MRALEACAAQEGDCLSKMQAFDGVERFSLTDGADLARKEILELQLPRGEGPRGLVIASRQSLASTYLFYQSLAYLGRSAGDTIAALERGDRTIGSALERLQQGLGGIEVAVETTSGHVDHRRGGPGDGATRHRHPGRCAAPECDGSMPFCVSREAIGASTTWHRFGLDRVSSLRCSSRLRCGTTMADRSPRAR